MTVTIALYFGVYECKYVWMFVCMCVYMSNLIITDIDMVINVHDTEIWFGVLLLVKSPVGQSQHCTSKYVHFFPETSARATLLCNEI